MDVEQPIAHLEQMLSDEISRQYVEKYAKMIKERIFA